MADLYGSDLRNGVALITGGASGFGRGCAHHFAARGIRVVIFDLNTDSLTTEADKTFDIINGNITSEVDVQKVADHIKQKYGRLDILINCAGISVYWPTYDPTTGASHTLELFNKVLQVNVVGTFNVIRLLVPIMAKNTPDSDGHRGVIINTSSVAGLEGPAMSAAYATSKAAIIGMTLPLAREFGPLGIRVVTLAPGYADTPMSHNEPEEIKKAIAAGFQKIAVFPKRMVTVAEFVSLVQAIVSNHAINGNVIRLDAGIRAQ